MVEADGGPLGIVVAGATVGDAVDELGLDLVAAATPVLAPGFGAQGGTVDSLAATFGAALGQQEGGGLAMFGGAMGMVLLPILYGIFGFIGGLIQAFIYNLAAGFVGGIRIETE